MSHRRDRVSRNTAPAVTHRIERATARRVHELSSEPGRIAGRLRALEEEWDVERVLETNAATLALGGSLLAIVVDRRFVAVPLVVTGFLLQHALQGWCPPLPVLRRLGVRTAREIERERTALKALRGDFDELARLRERIARVKAALSAA